MQNRRHHYRHVFPAQHRLRAKLSTHDGAVTHAGEIVNLSIGGICVKLDNATPGVEGSWHLQFALEVDNTVIQVRAERVHAQSECDQQYGMRFLFPMHIPTRDDLERKIWKYLLDVQRYERQLAQEAEKNAGYQS